MDKSEHIISYCKPSNVNVYTEIKCIYRNIKVYLQSNQNNDATI